MSEPRFQSCHCPAGHGEDCPLTLDECEARLRDYVGMQVAVAKVAKAEADLQALRAQLERAERHQAADHLAFDSMNHTAVDAETQLQTLQAAMERFRTEVASELQNHVKCRPTANDVATQRAEIIGFHRALHWVVNLLAALTQRGA